ncbi:unnamed protein product [Dovyalis caffra]|uniref:Uncharacterized protein n=1 Tax=Dovyalis caffra TaxID=77055 RepID=A0AAV1RL02_9ROSI|nr:unnamed protein product [Dovyalis caffra]
MEHPVTEWIAKINPPVALVAVGMEQGSGSELSTRGKASKCPRSSVRVDKDEQLFELGRVRVGSESRGCGVQPCERTFVIGSAYKYGAQGFFFVDGQSGN